MWRAIVGSIVLASCGFPRPQDVPDPGIDAVSDAGEPDAAACAQTRCVGDMLEVCGASGSVHLEPCALGCFAEQARCYGVEPSNKLAAALDQAVQEKAVELPMGALVNTETGVVSTALGTPIPVNSVMVAQPGGATMRVLLAQSWTLRDVQIRGALPVAFVAAEEIRVQGVLDASADSDTAGPGALPCATSAGGGGNPGHGFFVRAQQGNSAGYPDFLFIVNGSGGGGFGTSGGAGGLTNAGFAVGSSGATNGNAELVPLRGGCAGGSGDGLPPEHRGGGGGAVQLVAGHVVHVQSGGVIHVGGGRGLAGVLGRISDTDPTPVWGPIGGGSGGGILVEAPSVALGTGSGLLAAGGGGGGYGACAPGPDGGDAPADASSPAGGACPAGTTPTAGGGAGATAGDGAPGGSTVAKNAGAAGSGGGGLGRIRINTADGEYTASVNSLVRGVATAGFVGRR